MALSKFRTVFCSRAGRLHTALFSAVCNAVSLLIVLTPAETLTIYLSSFRLDADESWSVSANEWGLFTRYFDAPDCVKTLVQWAEEKCAAASVHILEYDDNETINKLLKDVFKELQSDSQADAEVTHSVHDDLTETPRKGLRKTREDEIEEVAAFLRTHLFVKVSHLRALSEQDWDKLSRQKIPYRVVKMLQSKVCQIEKGLRCIDYNVVISTSTIQQFCKSKEELLRPDGIPRDENESGVTSRSISSTESLSASVQKIKFIKVEKKGDVTIYQFQNLNPTIRLKNGDQIRIGNQKDSAFAVQSVVGNKVNFTAITAEGTKSSQTSGDKGAVSSPEVKKVETVPETKKEDAGAATKKEDAGKGLKSGEHAHGVSFVVDKVYPCEKILRQSTAEAVSDGLPKPDVTDDAAGVHSHAEQAMPSSPRKQSATSLESPRPASRQASSQSMDVPTSIGSSSKQQKKKQTKVTVSFDDKLLNSTLRVALQFLCDITCKSNKFLDYQRLFTTEKTLKYLIQVVEILGQSQKLLHQEIAVLAVRYPSTSFLYVSFL